jgi:hypothetical protein
MRVCTYERPYNMRTMLSTNNATADRQFLHAHHKGAANDHAYNRVICSDKRQSGSHMIDGIPITALHEHELGGSWSKVGGSWSKVGGSWSEVGGSCPEVVAGLRWEAAGLRWDVTYNDVRPMPAPTSRTPSGKTSGPRV